MTHQLSTAAALALGLCTFGLPATSQTVLSGDHSVDGSLCAGASCTGSESFTGADFKIKVINPELLFEDSSAVGAPTRDWRVLTNENGSENFVIEDVDAGRDVFWIEGNSRANSIYVSALGRLGLGTSLPVEEIHLAGSLSPAIRFETSSDGSAWDIRANSNFWWVEREPGGNFPFVLSNDAPSESFWMLDSGFIGLGTDVASNALHMFRDDNTATMLIEDTGAGTLGQMTLRNNGITFFTLEDTSIAVGDDTGRSWNFQNQGGTFRVTTAPGGAGDIEMILTPEGDMTIEGELTTAGSCSAGCDRVFDADYPLPTIAEHNAKMWANGHLPNVGPTAENGPFNVSDKMGRMLNELEHAHIFIGQQQDQIQAQESRIQAQDDRIAALETKLEALLSK